MKRKTKREKSVLFLPLFLLEIFRGILRNDKGTASERYMRERELGNERKKNKRKKTEN